MGVLRAVLVSAGCLPPGDDSWAALSGLLNRDLLDRLGAMDLKVRRRKDDTVWA